MIVQHQHSLNRASADATTIPKPAEIYALCSCLPLADKTQEPSTSIQMCRELVSAIRTASQSTTTLLCAHAPSWHATKCTECAQNVACVKPEKVTRCPHLLLGLSVVPGKPTAPSPQQGAHRVHALCHRCAHTGCQAHIGTSRPCNPTAQHSRTGQAG
jgi:hypothetical protein